MSKLKDVLRRKRYDYMGDDLLLIDELEDGRYRVFLPREDVEEILPTKEELREYLAVYDSDVVDKLIGDRTALNLQIRDIQKKRDAIQAQLDVAMAGQQTFESLWDRRDRVKAAVKLITADDSFWHRQWGEIKHVSINEKGAVGISDMNAIPIVSEEEEGEQDES